MKEYQIINVKATRAGFGDGLYEAAISNPNIVALSADLTD